MSHLSAIDKLMRVPECFTDKVFLRLTGMSQEAGRVALTRLKEAGLIQSAGNRSGVYFNLLKNKNAADEHAIEALLLVYPSAVLSGESVLHNAGWITQIPSRISVCVLQRKSYQQMDGFAITGKPLQWFRQMNTLLLPADHSEFPTFGLRAVPPAYALAELFAEDGGLDTEDVDIPADALDATRRAFAELHLDFTGFETGTVMGHH